MGKTKPNALCFCGSGKKYKKCCRKKEILNSKTMRNDKNTLFKSYFDRGNEYFQKKKYEMAIQSLKKAIKINPNVKECYHNLGDLYFMTKQYDEARIQYIKVLKIDPKYKNSYFSLGNIYYTTRQYSKAIVNYKKTLQIDINFKEAYNNLGVCYMDTLQYDKAIVNYKKAIEIDINYKDAHNNLGISYYDTRHYDKAEQTYNKSISIHSTNRKANSKAFYNLSLLKLLNKNFKEGFNLYRYRMDTFKTNHMDFISIPLPIWNRENTEGYVLIMSEQGFGDCFQFFRFIIPIKKKYPNIKFTFLCNEKIGHLFKDIIPIITSTSYISSYNYKVSLISLVHILNIEEITPYRGDSYINIDSSKISLWKNKLSTLKKLKVGICWQGNKNLRCIQKYIPLKLFKNISSLDIDLISLQKGDGEEELNTISFKDKVNSFRIDIDKPFIDTVAILKNIDLFITVDTSLVHLAAMLGVKTFLILGWLSEWRWEKSGNKSYWYNSVEIFRSETMEWDGVLKQVENRLKQIVKININN